MMKAIGKCSFTDSFPRRLVISVQFLAINYLMTKPYCYFFILQLIFYLIYFY